MLGNFLVPIMIGAKDLAFPKLNLASWYIYMIGGAVHAVRDRRPAASTPAGRSTRRSAPCRRRRNVIPTALGIFITGFSSILTGLNFIVTIHRMRAPGMTWFRLPLFVWSHYATSLIMVLGTPVIAITLLLVAAERLFHFGIFDPARRRRPGAVPAPVLVLLAPGRLHHDAAGDGRHQRAGRRVLPQAGVRLHASSRSPASAIAVLGFLVWGHHMFVAGQSVYAALIFSILSFLVAIPSAVKVFNWTATMYKGSISWETPMLYAIGFIGLFTIGGLTGLFLAAVGLDVHVTDTYFIVAHFHYIMVGGTIMGYLGGLHYWWPKISGRLYTEVLAQAQRRRSSSSAST